MIAVKLVPRESVGSKYLPVTMSTDPKDIERFLANQAQNRGNKHEELVFDKATGKLALRKKENVDAGNDRRVFREMTKFFGLAVCEVMENGGG